MKNKANKNILPRVTDKENRAMSMKDEFDDVELSSNKNVKTSNKSKNK